MNSLIVVGIVAVIIFAVCLSTYNAIIGKKNRVKQNWADVLVYLRYKLNLIPKLEEALTKYASHEREIFQKITELRSGIPALTPGAINPQAVEKIETATKDLIGMLRVTVENYPNLKADDLYKSFMNEVTETEENIAAAITIFNAGVSSFNNSIQQFPGNVINSNFNKETVIAEFSDSAAKKEIEYAPNF